MYSGFKNQASRVRKEVFPNNVEDILPVKDNCPLQSMTHMRGEPIETVHLNFFIIRRFRPMNGEIAVICQAMKTTNNFCLHGLTFKTFH